MMQSGHIREFSVLAFGAETVRGCLFRRRGAQYSIIRHGVETVDSNDPAQAWKHLLRQLGRGRECPLFLTGALPKGIFFRFDSIELPPRARREALEMEPLEAAAAEDFSDTEVNETVCLICEAVFPSPSDAIRHMKIVHGFDINELRKRMKYDFYNSVRFINYSRYMKSKHRCFICGCDVDGDYAQHISLHDEKIPDDLSRVIAEDQLLIPFIDGDPLLTELEDDIDCC